MDRHVRGRGMKGQLGCLHHGGRARGATPRKLSFTHPSRAMAGNRYGSYYYGTSGSYHAPAPTMERHGAHDASSRCDCRSLLTPPLTTTPLLHSL